MCKKYRYRPIRQRLPFIAERLPPCEASRACKGSRVENLELANGVLCRGWKRASEILCLNCANCGRDWTRDELKYKGLIFHDLRRTVVRNMVRAGVSERVAMSISGHKTRSVFDRYHIVAPSDLRDAARRLENSQQQEREALEKSRARQFGHSLGITAPKLQQNSKSLESYPSMAPLAN